MRFIFGVCLGVVMGVVLLVGTVAAFIGGLALGWKIFADSDDEEPTEPSPSGSPGHVRYQGMSAKPATTEEAPNP